LLSSINNLAYEIIVVDNNSTEESVFKFEKMVKAGKFPGVSFYRLDKNFGFGTGCNYGAKHAASDILCFLNPDTIVSEDIFKELISFLASNPGAAAVSPASTKSKYFDYSAGVFPSLFLEILNIFFFGRKLEAFYINFKHAVLGKNLFAVDWILGASIIIKKNIFNSLNGFDEDYFMFYEEMDLFYRIKSKDYGVFYYPSKKILHLGSVSTKKDYAFFTRTFYESKILFFRKQYGKFKSGIFTGITIIQIIVQIIFWGLSIPIFKNKSRSKIRGFLQVLNSFFKQ
jgi:GT2 family glycosyltransferase